MNWESILKNYGATKESEAIEVVEKLKRVGTKSGWDDEITFGDLLVITNIMANELKREESPELMNIMLKLDAANNDVEDMLIESKNYFEENEIDGIYWQRKQRERDLE